MRDKSKKLGLGGKIIAVIFLAVFSVAACFLSYKLAYVLVMVEKAQQWKVVNGELIHQDLHTSSRAGLHNSPTETLRASYRYTVDGTTYEGSSVDFLGPLGDNYAYARRSRQMDMLSEKPLKVFVNVEQPAQSVIDRTLPAETALFITFFLVFPCGFATLFIVGTALSVIKPLQPFAMPLTGMLHGAPALWLIIRHYHAYGFFGHTLLTGISLLFFFGLRNLIQKVTQKKPSESPTLPR